MSDELFERYQSDRDRRTYEQLVETHRPLVTSVCRRFLRDPNDIDDVVQETFLKFAGHVDSVKGSIGAWLAATAQSASVDLIRRAVRERNRRQGLAQLSGGGGVSGGSGGSEVEQLAARETIRLRLHEAMLVLDPAARDLLTERFLRKTPLRVLAGRMNVSVPTASRRAAAALRELAHVLREMGVTAASEQAVADQFNADARALVDPDVHQPDHGGLRFAPDWRSAELSPLGVPSGANAAPLLAGWTRPVRVGVMISYQSTRTQGVNLTYVGTKWQVHTTAFIPEAGLQLVAVVEPATSHRGVVESTVRDYSIVGGLIEADDERGLATLDVLLLGFNNAMSASVARAINRAVRGGVGLLNEFWTGSQVSRDDPAAVRELMLGDSDVYKYHMPGGECGTGVLPASIVREHPLLPGLKAGTRVMVRGCGPAYRVMPGALVLARKDYPIQPREHGMSDVGTLQMPCYILGQLGRGRVAVVHAWPHQWFIRDLNIGGEEYFLNLLRWLAAPRQEVG
jgi:RNA polymerase sigma factor (sigma-70 family)